MRRIGVAAATHVGRVREQNQDRLLVGSWVLVPGAPGVTTLDLEATDPVVVAVFDGMGGHSGGAIAANEAALELGARGREVRTGGGLRDVLELANRRVFAAMDATTAAMGTTAVALVSGADEVLIGNVGDARCYVDARGYLVQVTVDDVRPESGQLTQSLGGLEVYAAVDPHVVAEPWDGQRFVLASDGLSAVLGPGDLERCLRDDDAETAEALLEAALDAGGPDNITLAVVRVYETTSGGVS